MALVLAGLVGSVVTLTVTHAESPITMQRAAQLSALVQLAARQQHKPQQQIWGDLGLIYGFTRIQDIDNGRAADLISAVSRMTLPYEESRVID